MNNQNSILMKLSKIASRAALAAVAGLSVMSASAFPIAAPGSEGNSVVASGGTVTAKYEGNSAAYSNDLFLELMAGGIPGMDGDQSNDLFIFNNHATLVGTTQNIGSFDPGAELIFRLFVNNTGYNYYSGPASRNPDNLAHARVEDNWAPGTTLVSFEDLYGTPEGANGYNDLSFSFVNTRSTPSVPDAGSTVALLGVAMLGLGALKRKLR